MNLKRPVIHGFLVMGLITGVGSITIADDDNKRPSQEQIEFAKRMSDLLLATLFAALTQEFDETTVHNVEEGKLSISLIFNNQNKDMRLVGTFDPLQENNLPQDAFERTALKLALTGQSHTAIQRVQWYDDGDPWYEDQWYDDNSQWYRKKGSSLVYRYLHQAEPNDIRTAP
ncbi:hypothetical protein [Nitrosococcus wardiae]|uniref:Uncharacterized protein n=1 Tax=Nitrosococcus wardiae TaxID=1814290 RepID=A0A4P7BXT4_9GAMM|nr:hypothetical protein [Nitrosococcus wardiae]QBQ54009.1 hypothetical protein E3U44_05425 [Nitrosococcus wardiae]